MSFLSAGSSSAGAHPQPAANRYEIQAFFFLSSFNKECCWGHAGLALVRRRLATGPCSPPLPTQIPRHKGNCSSWGLLCAAGLAGSRTIGRSLVRLTADPTVKDASKMILTLGRLQGSKRVLPTEDLVKLDPTPFQGPVLHGSTHGWIQEQVSLIFTAACGRRGHHPRFSETGQAAI